MKTKSELTIIPDSESMVCGVTYVSITQDSGGIGFKATLRKSEVLLHNHINSLVEKYGIKESEIKELKDLIDQDHYQRALESEID